MFQVETLLDAFTKDSSLSHEEVIRALQDMNSKQDLREVFQVFYSLSHKKTNNLDFGSGLAQISLYSQHCSISTPFRLSTGVNIKIPNFRILGKYERC